MPPHVPQVLADRDILVLLAFWRRNLIFPNDFLTKEELLASVNGSLTETQHLLSEVRYKIQIKRASGKGGINLNPQTISQIRHGGSANSAGFSSSQLKNSLKILSQWHSSGLLDSEPQPKSGGTRGAFPLGYRLRDRSVITWPSSAAMVLTLDEWNGSDRDDFLRCAAEWKLNNPHTNNPLTSAEVGQQIAYCEAIGYITPRAGLNGRIASTSRVRQEKLYLAAITDDVYWKKGMKKQTSIPAI